MSKIMVCLGGNALGITPEEQLDSVRNASRLIVDLIEYGYDVVVSHGNGPQVGMIQKGFEIASKQDPSIPMVPFPECSAMSQGYIGYHLQQTIREELLSRDIDKGVASVITQVVVDENDPAFQNPTKPIGAFYTKEEAEHMEKQGIIMVEDSGRGYRRVIASPIPMRIVESDLIKTLVDEGHVVIACGGGGIPVIEKGPSLVGIPAVIDKDLASEQLAEVLDLDYLFILTAVDQVAVNFGKSNQRYLDEVSIDEVRKLISEGHFAPGSMLPKVMSALRFVESKVGRKAIITSIEKGKEAIKGETGTVFTR